MKLTNRWNRLVYRLWSPVYDPLLGRFFAPGRDQAIKIVDLQPGERVLLVGVGTGADLPMLPDGVQALGLDLSPHMLARAQARLPLPGRTIALVVGDALRLPAGVGQFDVAILSLVLSVVPDAARCLRETIRAVRPGGRIVVFDKFLPDGQPVTLPRRLLNIPATLFGTDINRCFSDLLLGTAAILIRDEPSLLHGTYRVILLKRPAAGAA